MKRSYGGKIVFGVMDFVVVKYFVDFYGGLVVWVVYIV